MTQLQSATTYYSTSTAITLNMLIMNLISEKAQPVITHLLPPKNIVSTVEIFKNEKKNYQSFPSQFFTNPSVKKPFIIQQPCRQGMKK